MKMAKEFFVKPASRMKGGVLVKDNKATFDLKPQSFKPKKVVIPLLQQCTKEADTTVQVGDHVKKGQLIGDSGKATARIHASVSGTVTDISKRKIAPKQKAVCVTIETDDKNEWLETLAPPSVTNADELIDAAFEAGLAGMGGAGFPTHIKLRSAYAAKAKTLILNSIECEPYITVDYRACVDYADDILRCVEALVTHIGFERVLIAVEDKGPKADEDTLIEKMQNSPIKDIIRLVRLKPKYASGAEKMLIKALLNKSLPDGKLPSDASCMVMNTSTTAAFGYYLLTGRPLINRALTVAGSAIKEPVNIIAPVGTLIGDIIEFVGGFVSKPYKLIMGGPMMGMAVDSTDYPITKTTNGILAFAEKMARVKKQTSCIRCGKCAEVCPMRIVPTDIYKAVTDYGKPDINELHALSAQACILCSCCAYICPSGIPLVEGLEKGKRLVKKGVRKNAECKESCDT